MYRDTLTHYSLSVDQSKGDSEAQYNLVKKSKYDLK